MDNDVDQALVDRYRNGDREAFTELVIRYQRPIYNAAFWILRSADDASDIAQDVFLRVAERLDEYDSHHKFFSWIYRIAVNESLNLLRRNGHQEWLDDEIDIAIGQPALERQLGAVASDIGAVRQMRRDRAGRNHRQRIGAGAGGEQHEKRRRGDTRMKSAHGVFSVPRVSWRKISSKSVS